MSKTTLRLAISILPLLSLAAAPPPARVTPMTPDVVAKNEPILLSRPPYDAKGSMSRSASQSVVDTIPIMYKEFVNDGYIIVQQDIRGLHNSEGEFVMNRPIVGPLNNSGIDESTDAYDAIDWLVKNVPESNGKLGTIG